MPDTPEPENAPLWPEVPPAGTAVPPSDPYQAGQTGQPGGSPYYAAGGQPNWPPPPVGSYAPPVGPQSSPVNGTLVLILGILGLTICGICAPIAWVLGNQALVTLNQYGDPLSQRGTVNGGRICGIVGTILIGVVLVIYAIAFAFGMLGALTHPSTS